jgi:UDP-N-acetylmuramate dehydrogenase
VTIERAVPLASLTTLGVGGPADRLITVETQDDLIAAIEESDAAGRRTLILGGGSNLVVGDGAFDGDVIRIATRGVDVVDASDCAGVTVTVAAGEPWDDVVQQAVRRGWVGIEALSGIPGTAGATPLQNVGAYGQEVAQTIAQVRTFDRRERHVHTFAAADCGFTYRGSRFRHQDRWIVLDVTFQFTVGELSAPIAYAELARTLGIAEGDRAPLSEVRDAVLALRRGKGMVIDADDPDTRSAGSFFTNPLLDAAQAAALPAEAPRWVQSDGRIKTSSAWLIGAAGFTKGMTRGSAAISSKHTLALTTRQPALAADVLALARAIQDGVLQRFGITLAPEPMLVNVPDDALLRTS